MRYPQKADGLARWVLWLDYRGRALYWSSDGQTVSGLSGTLVGSVEVADVVDRIDLDGADIREPMGLNVLWLDGQQPRDLIRVHAVVALVPDSGWADRYVITDGQVTRAELDRPGALIGLEVAPVDATQAAWPPASWTVTDRTWPTATTQASQLYTAYSVPPEWLQSDLPVTTGPDPSSTGRGYPVPYGRHSRTVPAMPVPIIDRHANQNDSDADLILVAGGVPASSSVLVWAVHDDVLTFGSTATPTAEIDAMGQPASVVDVSSYSNQLRKSKAWFASFDGISSPTPTAGAGHVAGWLLGSVGAIDLAWSGEAMARSTGLELAGYIDEPVQPLAWLQDRVAGRLPIATSRAPTGRLRMCWVPWLDCTPVAHLTDGLNGVLRAGPVSEVGQATGQRVEVRYRYHAQQGDYSATVTLQDGPTAATTATDVLDLDDVVSDATAATVGAYALWRNRARQVIRLDADAAQWSWLQPGMLVRYTDTELAISDALHIVLSITRTDRPFCALELMAT